MKVKVTQIMNGSVILNGILGQKLPFDVSWKIDELHEEAGKILKKFDKKRQEILKDSGAELDKESNEYKFPSEEKEEEANQAFKKEAEAEITLKSELLTRKEASKIDIEPGAIRHIKWMIKE